jgi:hypothetical protein
VRRPEYTLTPTGHELTRIIDQIQDLDGRLECTTAAAGEPPDPAGGGNESRIYGPN